MDIAEARRVFRDMPVTRVATVDADGGPHVVPLWFVWRDEAIYVSASRSSRTWANAQRDPRVALLLDVGRNWSELAGVVVRGRADLLATDHPMLRGPISAWYEKYRRMLGGGAFRSFTEGVRDLGFLRIVPARHSWWDHARP